MDTTDSALSGRVEVRDQLIVLPLSVLHDQPESGPIPVDGGHRRRVADQLVKRVLP
jgi:hypothetical protein